MQIHTKGKKNENRRIEGKYKGKKQKDKGQCFNLWFVNCYCLEITKDV